MVEHKVIPAGVLFYLFTSNGDEILYVFYVNNVYHFVKAMAEGIVYEESYLTHNLQNSRKRVFSDR